MVSYVIRIHRNGYNTVVAPIDKEFRSRRLHYSKRINFRKFSRGSMHRDRGLQFLTSKSKNTRGHVDNNFTGFLPFFVFSTFSLYARYSRRLVEKSKNVSNNISTSYDLLYRKVYSVRVLYPRALRQREKVFYKQIIKKKTHHSKTNIFVEYFQNLKKTIIIIASLFMLFFGRYR